MATGEKHQLLNVKAFDGNGFSTWEYRVRLILEQRDVLDVLSSDPPVDEAQRANFKKSDVKARNIIVQCLDDSILEMVKDKTTAKEMINTLKATYEKTGISTQISLQRKLRSMKFNGKTSLQDYLVEYEKLIAELKKAGGKIENEEVITQLLSGLPESYQSVVIALDVLFCQNSSSVTLDFVKNRLLMEEERQRKNMEDSEAKEQHVFVGYKGRFNKKQSWNKSASTESKNTEQGQSTYVFKGKCFTCGKRGHKRYECSHRKGTANVVEEQKEKEESGVVFLTEVGSWYT